MTQSWFRLHLQANKDYDESKKSEIIWGFVVSHKIKAITALRGDYPVHEIIHLEMLMISSQVENHGNTEQVFYHS